MGQKASKKERNASYPGFFFLAMNYFKLYFTHKIIYNFKKSCDMLILYVSSSFFFSHANF